MTTRSFICVLFLVAGCEGGHDDEGSEAAACEYEEEAVAADTLFSSFTLAAIEDGLVFQATLEPDFVGDLRVDPVEEEVAEWDRDELRLQVVFQFLESPPRTSGFLAYILPTELESEAFAHRTEIASWLPPR